MDGVLVVLLLLLNPIGCRLFACNAGVVLRLTLLEQPVVSCWAAICWRWNRCACIRCANAAAWSSALGGSPYIIHRSARSWGIPRWTTP
jgi:hypothetical protein